MPVAHFERFPRAPLLARGHLPLIPLLAFHSVYPRANGIRAISHFNIHFTSLQLVCGITSIYLVFYLLAFSLCTAPCEHDGVRGVRSINTSLLSSPFWPAALLVLFYPWCL